MLAEVLMKPELNNKLRILMATGWFRKISGNEVHCFYPNKTCNGKVRRTLFGWQVNTGWHVCFARTREEGMRVLLMDWSRIAQ